MGRTARWILSLALAASVAGHARAGTPAPEVAESASSTESPAQRAERVALEAEEARREIKRAKKRAKRAKKLAKKAKKLLKKERWDKAAEVLDAAAKLDPLPAYMRGAGEAHERAGRALEALARYERCAAKAPPCARGRGRVRRALREVLGEVVVEAEPEGSRVRLEGGDQVLLGPAPLTVWVHKGTWLLHVTKPGWSPDRRSLPVPLGRTTTTKVRLLRPLKGAWSASDPRPPDTPDPAGGDALAARGRAAHEAGERGDAIEAFTEAYRADGDPRHLASIAGAHEAAGDLSKAVGVQERVVDEARDEGARDQGRARLVQLRKRLVVERGTVVVNALPPGAEVRLTQGERVEVGAAPLRRSLGLGSWDLKVSAPKHVSHERTLTVEPGKPSVLSVRLEGVAAPVQVGPPPPLEPPPEPPSAVAAEAPSTMMRWALIAAGALVMVSGVVYALL